jgi:hypothetical protein
MLVFLSFLCEHFCLALTPQACQYLNFCTSKLSKETEYLCILGLLHCQQGERLSFVSLLQSGLATRCVSICTFVPVSNFCTSKQASKYLAHAALLLSSSYQSTQARVVSILRLHLPLRHPQSLHCAV